MAAKVKPDIDQIAGSLANEVLVGSACLKIAQGLQNADRAVLGTARIFFFLALEGNLQLAQIYAARLFDRTAGAISVHSFILEAKTWAAELSDREEAAAAAQAISSAESRIASLKPILSSLLRRRNQALAHLDPTTVVDPDHLDQSAALTLPELEKVFVETVMIFNEINVLRTGITSNVEFVGVEDYQMALTLISEAKCARTEIRGRPFKQTELPQTQSSSR